MFLVTTVLGWFTGGGFKMLSDIYAKNKDSQVESERIEAHWAAEQLSAMTSVRMATAGYWEMRLLTFCIGGTFTLHLMLVGLATMFGWTWDGRPVNAFPKPMNEWEGAILLSFFGLTAGVVGIKALASALQRR